MENDDDKKTKNEQENIDIVHPDDRLVLEKAKEHSKKYAATLMDLVKSNLPEPQEKITKTYSPAEKTKPSLSFRLLLSFLQIFPYLLGIGFLSSFYWDFSGISTQIFGKTLHFDGIIRIISVSGLIGFFTNWLAITMLFKPVHKRPLLGQGLVPAHKERIAARLAFSVSTELINPELIRKKLEDNNLIGKYRERFLDYTRNVIDAPDFRNGLKTLVKEYIQEMIGDQKMREVIARKVFQQLEKAVEDKQFENIAFKAYKFVRGDEAQAMIERAIGEIPTKLESSLDGLDRMLDRLPNSIDEHSENLEKWASQAIYHLVAQLDVYSIVEENLNKYDEQKFEKLIRGATNEQLNYIQYLGALLGTIGGLVIWEPLISLGALTTLGGALFLLDTLLGRLQKN